MRFRTFALPYSFSDYCLHRAPGWLAAQSTGSMEFTAQVAPTDGRPEPVRQLTFYLLRKSLEDIRQEALQLEPAPGPRQIRRWPYGIAQT